jgi:PTS system mannitol-specific IIA component
MTTHLSLAQLLAESSIVLDATATDVDDAIRQAGAALVATGAVEPDYIDAMLERERTVSTYVGEGVAVPHGTLSAKGAVKRNALVLLRLADGLDWNGNDVRIVIGLAAVGRGHIGLLSRLAGVLLDPDRAAALRTATDNAEIYQALSADAPTP